MRAAHFGTLKEKKPKPGLFAGQRWYSFGWESQLLETALLGALAAPALTGKVYP